MLNIDIKGWEDQEPPNIHNLLIIHELSETPNILDTLNVRKANEVLEIYEVEN